MPVLIITPDISAETWLGAAGWASGSQTWNGMTPALVPKPTSASRKQTLAASGERPRPSASKSSEEREASRKNIGGRQSDPRCVATRYVQEACRTSAFSWW